MAKDYIAYEGERVIVEYARLGDGTMPAKDYFDGLSEGDQVRIGRVWAYIGRNPQFRNREKFKVVEGRNNLQEIKSYQARMFTAWASKGTGTKRRLLLLSGLKSPKKQAKLSTADIERAIRVRDEHFKCWENQREGQDEHS